MIQSKLVELHKIQFGLEQIISKELLLNPTINVEDYLFNTIKIRVQGYIFGEYGESQEIKYPTDWWQAFKLRYFPAWALVRWPVKYVEYEIKFQTLYPNFRISLPKEQHVLRFIVNIEKDR